MKLNGGVYVSSGWLAVLGLVTTVVIAIAGYTATSVNKGFQNLHEHLGEVRKNQAVIIERLAAMDKRIDENKDDIDKNETDIDRLQASVRSHSSINGARN